MKVMFASFNFKLTVQIPEHSNAQKQTSSEQQASASASASASENRINTYARMSPSLALQYCNKKVADRKMQPISAHPVLVSNVPHTNNSCFISASLQFFAAFLSNETLASIRSNFVNGNNDKSLSIKDQVTIELKQEINKMFTEIIEQLKKDKGTCTKRQIQLFLRFLKIYVVVTNNFNASIINPNIDKAKKIVEYALSINPSNKKSAIDYLVKNFKDDLQPQDSMEFFNLMNDILMLDTIKPLVRDSQFAFVRTATIDLDNSVKMISSRIEDSSILFNLALSEESHASLKQYNLGQSISNSLVEFREKRVERTQAQECYRKAKITLPSVPYDKTKSHSCRIVTHLRINPSFKRLILTFGIFKYDKQTGQIAKYADEAVKLISHSHGYLQMKNIFEYDKPESNTNKMQFVDKRGEITAILCHEGKSVENGHYMTLRKLQGTWYVFDDIETKHGRMLKAKYSDFKAVEDFITTRAAPYAIIVEVQDIITTDKDIQIKESPKPEPKSEPEPKQYTVKRKLSERSDMVVQPAVVNQEKECTEPDLKNLPPQKKIKITY